MGSGVAKAQDVETFAFYEPLPAGTPLHYSLETGSSFSCASAPSSSNAPVAEPGSTRATSRRRSSVTIGGVTVAGEKAPTKAYKLWHQILYPAEPNEADSTYGRGGVRKAPSTYRGILVFCHGVLEHSSRYLHVMGQLASEGFVVAAQDHLGHGRSEDHEAGKCSA